jgi:D-hydroxyproline dehydrogenase subunit beta
MGSTISRLQGPAPGATADVIVVGAGLLGCATAFHLAERGARVTIVEREAVAAGASGRNSGSVEHPYDIEQCDLYADSLAQMRSAGVPVAQQPAGIVLLATDRGGLDGGLALAAGFLELDATVLDPDELSRIEPAAARGLWGCLLSTGFPLAPDAATRSYAERATALGVRVIEGDAAELVVRGRRCAGVRAGGTLLEAGAVVVAAGAWSAAVIDPTGSWRPVTQMWGVSVEAAGLAQAPARALIEATVAVSQAGPPAERSATPFTLITAGGRSLVGSTFLHRRPRAEDWIPRLLQRARRFVPSIEGTTVGESWVCPRPWSVDGRPLLGAVGARTGLFIAAGHGGRGISTGAASAALVAEAVITDTDDAIRPLLRASRVPPPAWTCG